jgi:hydrophobe/amphiphile efflux-3 (HAE3) family protein
VNTFARFVTRHAVLTLTVVAGLTLLALACLVDVRTGEIRLGLDPSLDRFMPEGNPEREFYDEMVRRFGNDENLTVAVLTDDVFTPDILPRIDRMTQRFKQVDGVRDVVSLSTALNIRGSGGDLLIEPFYSGLPDDPGALETMRREALANPIYSGNLVSKDGRTTAIVVLLRDMTEYEFAQKAVDRRLLEIAEEERGPAQVWITGPSRIKAETTRAILSDLVFIIPASFLAISTVAFASFLTIRGVLVPAITVGIALVWTLAIMVLLGRSLNLVTTIVPNMILTVGFAYAVHVIAGYYAMLRGEAGDEGREHPVYHGLQEVLLPLLLTAVTTCVGLLALMVSPMSAIREFGLFASIGVGATVLASITFAPALLQLMPVPRQVAAAPREGVVDRLFEGLARFDLRHRRTIMLVTTAICVLAVWGTTRIRVSNDLVASFPEDSPVRTAFAAINEHLDGANPFYIVLDTDVRDAFKQPKNLAEVEALQRWLEAEAGVGSVTSLVDYVKIINWGFHDNDPAYLAIPESAALTDQLLFFGGNEEVEGFADSRYQITRLLVRAQVIDSVALRDVLRRVRARLEELPRHITGTVTGNTVLVTEASDDIARGQAQSLVVAFLAIYLILSMLFTSFGVGFIALIPNIVPVLIYFGTLGWMDIPLNTTTGLAACVVLGIAVDDSIHYITRFSVCAKECADEQQGTIAALRSVGRPVTYTTAALCLGFLTLTFTEMRNQVHFGALASFTLFIAWVVDLTLTPALCSGLRVVTLWDVVSLDLGKDPQTSIPILRGLRRAQARVVALMTDLRSFPKGHALFHVDDTGNDMYVVVDGELSVWLDVDGARQEIKRLSRGDVVGEIAPFHGTRTANVDAMTDVRLLRLTLEDLRRLERRYPRIGAVVYRNLSWILANRIAATLQRMRH